MKAGVCMRLLSPLSRDWTPLRTMKTCVSQDSVGCPCPSVARALDQCSPSDGLSHRLSSDTTIGFVRIPLADGSFLAAFSLSNHVPGNGCVWEEGGWWLGSLCPQALRPLNGGRVSRGQCQHLVEVGEVAHPWRPRGRDHTGSTWVRPRMFTARCLRGKRWSKSVLQPGMVLTKRTFDFQQSHCSDIIGELAWWPWALQWGAPRPLFTCPAPPPVLEPGPLWIQDWIPCPSSILSMFLTCMTAGAPGGNRWECKQSSHTYLHR